VVVEIPERQLHAGGEHTADPIVDRG
jgi:hypothetical protein